MRNQTLLFAAAALVAGAAATPALAADGCGRGFHRIFNGRCVPNGPRAGVVVAPGPGVELVVGRWYPGRGWWDGRRYYWHRAHWHRGWRYY
jgi:hypothetical protein